MGVATPGGCGFGVGVGLDPSNFYREGGHTRGAGTGCGWKVGGKTLGGWGVVDGWVCWASIGWMELQHRWVQGMAQGCWRGVPGPSQTCRIFPALLPPCPAPEPGHYLPHIRVSLAPRDRPVGGTGSKMLPCTMSWPGQPSRGTMNAPWPSTQGLTSLSVAVSRCEGAW